METEYILATNYSHLGKIRTFEFLSNDFIKEIFILFSLIFASEKLLLEKGLKCKFSKFIWFGGIANLHYILNRKSMSNLVRNKSVISSTSKFVSFPNFLCVFKQNSPFLHSILTEVLVYINLILP